MTSPVQHPFEGGIPYPWDRPEARELHRLLSRDVTVPGQIDLFLRSYAPGAPALNTAQAPPELWRIVLDAVSLADGLLELCTELANNKHLVAVSVAARTMLDAKPAVHRLLGGDSRLVLDRSPFREYLADLGTDSAVVKVLLVRGQPHTGKTWSKYLFERAARDRGADPLYLDSGIVATVGEVVDKLFSKVNALDQVPPGDTTETAWYRLVCNRLPGHVERRGRPLWIAVDDLGPGPDQITPLMDRDILRFFQQFVLHLADPSTHRWFRLLLIHYPDEEVPTKWEQDVWREDRTRADTVTATEVAEVLLEWADDHGRNLVEDQLKTAAADVIARAEAPLPAGDPRAKHPRLRRIHDEVKLELAGLARQIGDER